MAVQGKTLLYISVFADLGPSFPYCFQLPLDLFCLTIAIMYGNPLASMKSEKRSRLFYFEVSDVEMVITDRNTACESDIFHVCLDIYIARSPDNERN